MSRLYPCVYCTEDGHCKKFSDEEAASWCVQGPCQYEKLSNADRIRAMTDEELAEYHSKKCGCPHDPIVFGCRMATIGCIGCWLDWLKEEVDNAEQV